MSRFLYRIGSATFRQRLAFILAWVAVLVALGIGSVTLAGETTNEFRIPGQESTTAFELMEQRFGSGASNASAQVVVQAPPGQTLTAPENANKTADIVRDMKALPGVIGASDPLNPAAPTIAPDQRTAFSTVTYGVTAIELLPEQQEALMTAVENAGANSGLTVEVTGEASQEASIPGGIAEIIGVGIALLILIVTYGSLVTAGMNLITALVGVAVGALGVTVATGFMDLQATTPLLATMLGLAVGIDYALFIVSRFRSELRDGKDVGAAVAMAVGTAGSAVVTAGLTVVIALVGLLVVNIPFLGEMGVAAAATVVVAVLVAITLVPAVLSYLGKRVLPKRQRATIGSAEEASHERGFYRGWANGVTRGRWVALLAAIAALLVISIPLLSMKTSLAVAPADDSTQGRATQLLDENFGPGTNNPILVFIDGEGASERAKAVALDAAALPDVVIATPAASTPDGKAALVTVIPNSGPSDDETTTLIGSLRDQLNNGDGPKAYVTGVAAITIDITETLSEALPIYLILVVSLALILLVLVFRSILVPLVGVLGFLLTIGAALGATVAVFQWGWLSDVFQPPSVGPIMSLVPILVVGILFGLAMDYQVFLVSRMHEEHAHGLSPREAITVGFRHAAPVVTAAAAIMFAVFAGFISESDVIIKSIGFALAVGVFFDAFVVRMVIMPATLAILGKAAWWFPSWLEWLPHLDVEGEALRDERKTPVIEA